MSSLLNRSISEIAQQGRGGRASPYNRSASSSRPSSDDKWGHDGFEELNKRDRRSTVPTEKLIVEGLHWEVSEEELRGLFEAMGPVRRCFIKYDRSGRSTGVAIVHYESVADATRARSEYDGANAKGQPITISFEEVKGARGGPGGGRGAAAVPGGSLQSRFDLLSRLGGERPQAPANAPKGPSNPSASDLSRGNVRGVSTTSRGESRNVRGGGRAVGRGGRGVGAGAGGREKRLPKSATDLDAELDAFMRAPPGGAAESNHAPKAGEDADVEMK